MKEKQLRIDDISYECLEANRKQGKDKELELCSKDESSSIDHQKQCLSYLQAREPLSPMAQNRVLDKRTLWTLRGVQVHLRKTKKRVIALDCPF